MSNDWDTVIDAYLHGDLSPDQDVILSYNSPKQRSPRLFQRL